MFKLLRTTYGKYLIYDDGKRLSKMLASNDFKTQYGLIIKNVKT